MVEFDLTIVIFAFGSIVTSVVGFVVIWNVIRISKRDTKEDLEKSSKDLEGRIKDHINYKVELLDNKVDNVENKVNGINEDIKKKEDTMERKFEALRDWLRNVESRVVGGNRYYKGGVKGGDTND